MSTCSLAVPTHPPGVATGAAEAAAKKTTTVWAKRRFFSHHSPGCSQFWRRKMRETEVETEPHTPGPRKEKNAFGSTTPQR